MKILLISLAITVLFCGFSVPFVLKAFARRRADQINYGLRQCSKKQINRYISILVWTNEWLTGRKEPDYLRIDRLKAKL